MIIVDFQYPAQVMSMAMETENLLWLRIDSPLITKPPVPEAMADNSMAAVSCLPNKYPAQVMSMAMA
jgi:hypothetical protein